MYSLCAGTKKSGRCREVAVSRRSIVNVFLFKKKKWSVIASLPWISARKVFGYRGCYRGGAYRGRLLGITALSDERGLIRRESLIGRRWLRSYVELSTIVKFGQRVVIAGELSTLRKLSNKYWRNFCIACNIMIVKNCDRGLEYF